MYDILEQLCNERGVAITKLCKDVTGSSGNLSTWKKGYMRSDYLKKAAEILNVSADYLLGKEEVGGSNPLDSLINPRVYVGFIFAIFLKLHSQKKVRNKKYSQKQEERLLSRSFVRKCDYSGFLILSYLCIIIATQN